MSLTVPADYIGINSISKNKYDLEYLQEYLTELEPIYLQDLLGCDLYDLFVADLDPSNVPQTARFIDIYNAFCIDLDNGGGCNNLFGPEFFDCYCNNGQNKSRGFKEMLKSFMYFEYVREQQITNSSIGASKSKGVASDLTRLPATAITRNYNKGVNDYNNIQYFICENIDIYPEYNGIKKGFTGII